MIPDYVNRLYETCNPKFIHLPDIPLSVGYYARIPYPNYNVYLFQLHYKRKKIKFICTSDRHTGYKLPVHQLMCELFKYKNAPYYKGLMEDHIQEHAVTSTDSHFEICCWLLRSYKALKNGVSRQVGAVLCDMFSHTISYDWYKNGKPMTDDSILDLDVDGMEEDFDITAKAKTYINPRGDVYTGSTASIQYCNDPDEPYHIEYDAPIISERQFQRMWDSFRNRNRGYYAYEESDNT